MRLLHECGELIRWLSPLELLIITCNFPLKLILVRDIHDEISRRTRKLKRNIRPLHQEIIFLDGVSFNDFTIEVPKDTADLINTSDEMNHCVHGYDERVIRKKCQIINLKKDNKRIYTIELVPKGGIYQIDQFKGYNNESSMEGPSGYKYQRELIHLITKLKPTPNPSSK